MDNHDNNIQNDKVKTVLKKKHILDSQERLFENRDDLMKIGEDVYDSIDHF